jgi:hypothetical protein
MLVKWVFWGLQKIRVSVKDTLFAHFSVISTLREEFITHVFSLADISRLVSTMNTEKQLGLGLNRKRLLPKHHLN